MQSVRSEKGKAEAEKKAQHLEQVGIEKTHSFEQVGTEKAQTGGHQKNSQF